MSTMTRPRSSDILATEEAAAWDEYLEATRGQGARYEEVEPWAWSRLRTWLRAIEARRSAARPAEPTAAEGSSPAGGDEVTP